MKNMGDRDNRQGTGEEWVDDKTRLLARKSGQKKPSLLREAINAVDAALGSDRKSRNRGQTPVQEVLPAPERAEIREIEYQSSQEIIEQALIEMKSDSEDIQDVVAESAPYAPHMENRQEEDASVVRNPVINNAGVDPLQGAMNPGRTQRIRVKPSGDRPEFFQEPVVAWLVIVQGPGLGTSCAVYEGNNTIGRASSQHVQLDFGDDAISAEEQAFIRYDPQDRSYLFVPNLAKTNVVSLNEDKPTSAVPLKSMDIISMGRTRMAFVPFCGEEFDWSDI